jgi:hypothetical protein
MRSSLAIRCGTAAASTFEQVAAASASFPISSSRRARVC